MLTEVYQAVRYFLLQFAVVQRVILHVRYISQLTAWAAVNMDPWYSLYKSFFLKKVGIEDMLMQI